MGDIPAPDKVPGAPHPRLTRSLYGHEVAEATFLEAWHTGRIHHAWLIHGPRGIGKATLAYRIARFIFSGNSPDAHSLQVPEDHPAAKRVAAESEARLFVLRRVLNPDTRRGARARYYTVIRVDDVRALRIFFQRTALSGGWRIAIVDTADDMNVSACNALLKILEEPPERSLILLACHAPRRLPATVLSRCRRLRLGTLAGSTFERAVRGANASVQKSAMQLLEQESEGAPGEALRIHALGGVDLRREIDNLLADLPELDRRRLAAFTNSLAAADDRNRRILATDMLERALADLARTAAGAGRPVSDLARRLEPLASNSAQARVWATAVSGLRASIEDAGSVNISPSATLLTVLASIETAAAQARRVAA